MGAPIGTQAYCAEFMASRVTKAKKTLDAIARLEDPQVGLRLLRNCASFCKMVYAARTADPAAMQEPFAAFDKDVRSCFTELTGFSPTDTEWTQAQLGLGHAGLGLRSAVRHAPAAYFASRVGTRHLCGQMDPAYVWDDNEPGSALSSALSALAASLPPSKQALLQPSGTLKQKDLSDALDKVDFERRLAGAEAAVKAAVLSETLKGASGFITAIPCKALRLCLEPAEFVVELQRRLGAQIFDSDDFCPLCDTVMDTRGFHASVCTCGGDKTAGHNAARSLVYHYASAAGCRPDLEPGGLLPPRPEDPEGSSLRRPADIYVPRWRGGTPAALDLAITSPQRQSALALAANEAGAAAKLYEEHKKSFLDTEAQCAQQGISFIPVVAESSGGWGPSGLFVLRTLAKRAAAKDGVPASVCMSQLLEGLSIAVRRIAARAVLRRAAPRADFAPLAADTAASILAVDAAAAAAAAWQ